MPGRPFGLQLLQSLLPVLGIDDPYGQVLLQSWNQNQYLESESNKQFEYREHTRLHQHPVIVH